MYRVIASDFEAGLEHSALELHFVGYRCDYLGY